MGGPAIPKPPAAIKNATLASTQGDDLAQQIMSGAKGDRNAKIPSSELDQITENVDLETENETFNK